MNRSPLEKRAARKDRNKSMMDLNLVSLIDIFIILIFFLLTNASEVEVLPSSRAVRLPESIAEKGRLAGNLIASILSKRATARETLVATRIVSRDSVRRRGR